ERDLVVLAAARQRWQAAATFLELLESFHWAETFLPSVWSKKVMRTDKSAGDQVHARRHQNHRTRGSAWRNLQSARPEVACSPPADRPRHFGFPVIPSRGRASSRPGARERRASCRQETRRKVWIQAEVGSASGARSRP